MFAMMTKKDKLRDMDDDLDREIVECRKKTIREGLGIGHTRLLLMQNYCHEVDKELKYCEELDPSIDEPITRFFMQICESSVENEDSSCLWGSKSELFYLKIKSIFKGMRKCVDKISTPLLAFLLPVVIVLFTVLLYVLAFAAKIFLDDPEKAFTLLMWILQYPPQNETVKGQIG